MTQSAISYSMEELGLGLGLGLVLGLDRSRGLDYPTTNLPQSTVHPVIVAPFQPKRRQAAPPLKLFSISFFSHLVLLYLDEMISLLSLRL
jgi:hypothetical protein